MTIRIDRLQAIREKRGLSQRELARLCGIGESLISKYENGWGDPNTATLKLIAETLNISADYILGIVDEPQQRLGDTPFADEERNILDTFRREGWQGVARLSVEHLSK